MAVNAAPPPGIELIPVELRRPGPRAMERRLRTTVNTFGPRLGPLLVRRGMGREVPDAQLARQVRRAFQKLGASAIHCPGMYHTSVNLDLPVSIGGYECTKKPDEPIVVHMMKAACKPGRPAREQHKLGRIQLYTTTFETYERNIREQLARMLGPGGFDPARDILEITVNRWPHGYAYEYNSLADEFWLKGGETPCEVAQKPFGRLAIANSDADAYAYTDCAIDQAYRAVQELKK